MKKYVIFFLIAFFSLKLSFSGTIRIRYPNGGQTLYVGDTITITWDAIDVNNGFKIALLKDNRGFGIIANNVDNEDRSFNWQIGTLIRGTITPGTTFKIKVQERRTSDSDSSDSNFTITFRPVTESLQRSEPSEYSIESLTFQNSAGVPLNKTNGIYYIPYNGQATKGRVMAKMRWNKKSPGSGVHCAPRVEFKLRYLGRPATRFKLLETKDANFNGNGQAEVIVPFTISPNKDIGLKVNLNARLLDMATGCDKNHRNNSRGNNLQLGLVPEHGPGACDLKIAIDRSEFELLRLYGKVPKGKAPDAWYFRAKFKIHVKQLNLTRGVLALPLANVKCNVCFQRRLETGRWISFPTTSVTLPSVNSLDWAVKNINYRFNTPPNWWDNVRFKLEVDPEKVFNDVNPSNNVFYFVFKVQ
jgi:hypothetical protein